MLVFVLSFNFVDRQLRKIQHLKENGGLVLRTIGRWCEWEAKNGAVFYVCNNQYGGQWEKPKVIELQDQEYYSKASSGINALSDKLTKKDNSQRQHEVVSLGNKFLCFCVALVLVML